MNEIIKDIKGATERFEVEHGSNSNQNKIKMFRTLMYYSKLECIMSYKFNFKSCSTFLIVNA